MKYIGMPMGMWALFGKSSEGGKKRRNVRMDTLQSGLIVAAIVFLVLAFCSGIKAACRRILSKIGGKE